jgi:hypothetical protein
MTELLADMCVCVVRECLVDHDASVTSVNHMYCGLTVFGQFLYA